MASVFVHTVSGVVVGGLGLAWAWGWGWGGAVGLVVAAVAVISLEPTAGYFRYLVPQGMVVCTFLLAGLVGWLVALGRGHSQQIAKGRLVMLSSLVDLVLVIAILANSYIGIEAIVGLRIPTPFRNIKFIDVHLYGHFVNFAMPLWPKGTSTYSLIEKKQKSKGKTISFATYRYIQSLPH